jgi:hypothetical protein
MEHTREAAPDRSHHLGQGDMNIVYQELCAHTRATDEISLKLMTAIPLVTGIGIVLLMRAPGTAVPQAAVVLLSLFAALVTFAIYRWERKNMENCRHFRRWAAFIEQDYYGLRQDGVSSTPNALPHGRIPPPRRFGLAWTKTEALRLLYWVAILGWISTGIYATVA